MMISIIAAVSKNGVIGREGGMPWDQPADLAYFQKTTKEHTIIMGRKTFESIGSKPLPKRKNIVISSNQNLANDNVIVVDSLISALEQCTDDSEVFIIGGGQIYQEAIKIADKLYLTQIEVVVDEGDTYFPDMFDWKQNSHEKFLHDERNKYDMSFNTYIRKL